MRGSIFKSSIVHITDYMNYQQNKTLKSKINEYHYNIPIIPEKYFNFIKYFMLLFGKKRKKKKKKGFCNT